MFKKIIMVSIRCTKRFLRWRCFMLMVLPFVLSVCYVKFIAVRHQITGEEFKDALLNSDNFIAATRTNPGKISTGSWVCVVDPTIFDCSYQGMASFLLYTLDDIAVCHAMGSERPVVFWRACFSVCSKDSAVNSWEWYFEPVNRGLESKVEKVLCPLFTGKVLDSISKKTIWNKSFKKRTDLELFQQGLLITTEERIRVNKLIQRYVKPNERITREVDTFYHKYLAGNTVLGVHVRGTDHWTETTEKRLPPLMSWVKSAQSILETLPRPRKIFIASDNDEIIEKFASFFGEETVVFIEAFRAKKYHGAPSHYYDFEYDAADPFERILGTQILLDILLLAKCDHFLHAESSVASLASYFNPNMTSIFMESGKKNKKKGKVRERRRTDLQKEEEEEEEEEEKEKEKVEEEEERVDGVDIEELNLAERLKCFEKNAASSPCPNVAKGNFVNFDEAQDFLGHL